MKENKVLTAKVIETGKIVNVKPYFYTYDENDEEKEFITLEPENGSCVCEVYNANELEFLDEPDWEQIHIQASIAAMQGMISGGRYNQAIDELINAGRFENNEQAAAEWSVLYADELVKQLKEKWYNEHSKN